MQIIRELDRRPWNNLFRLMNDLHRLWVNKSILWKTARFYVVISNLQVTIQI